MDVVLKYKFKQFDKIINSPKIDLVSSFIYYGAIENLQDGIEYSELLSILDGDVRIDNFIYKLKDDSIDDEIQLKYSLEEIKKGFEYTNYEVGVNEEEAKYFKNYFELFAKEDVNHQSDKYNQVNKVTDISKWVYEVKNNISQEFVDKIGDSIPTVDENNKQLDDVEKVIYLYLTLCNELTYDDNFFVNRDEIASYHQDFANIKNINLKNNNVICYEFNPIFAFLAEKYGFKASIADIFLNFERQEVIVPINEIDKVKNAHYSLVLSNDDYDIFFDSTRGSLDIDLLNVKTGRNLKGIKSCNDYDKEYINYKIEKTYELFLSNHQISKSSDYVPIIVPEHDLFNIKEILKEIASGKTSYVEIDFEEKINTYLDISKNLTLKGMDAISYLYVLFKKIFSNTKHNAHFRIIRTNEENPLEQRPVLVVIFSNKESKDLVENRRYYVYEENKGFNYIETDDILNILYEQKYITISDEYDIIDTNKRGSLC